VRWRSRVGLLLLVAAIAIAAMVRPDIPLEALLPEYGAPPSQFVEIEGMRIHYRDEGAGPPLVLAAWVWVVAVHLGWLGVAARRQAAADPPRPARVRADRAGTRRRLPRRAICPRRRGAARFARRRAHRYRRQLDGRAHRTDVRARAPRSGSAS
jgi:hypothetical protein